MAAVRDRTAPNLARPGRRTARHGAVLAVLCVSLLIVSLDNTILNVALPVLVKDLHASTSQLQWIVDAYAVVFAGLLLVGGSQADRLGRKWVLMAGLAVFAAGSAASAFSGSPGRLIAARAFMGVGAAAIMPSTLSLLTNVFDTPDERRRAIGVWSGTTGVGIAIGPIAGGWLLAHFWWGSVFLVNVPIALLGIAAAALVVPNSKDSRHRPADPKGAVLSIAAMALLLWGIIEAPGRTWQSPWVLGAVGLAMVLLTAFFVSERRTAYPMLTTSLFTHRRFSVAIAAMALVMFTLMGMLFITTQYLQFSLGYSALATGLRITPIAAVLLVTAPTSTLLVRRFGTKVVVCGGLLCVAGGLLVLSSTTVTDTYADALPAFLLIGLGAGLAFAPCTDAVMGELAPAETGVGAGLAALARGAFVSGMDLALTAGAAVAALAAVVVLVLMPPFADPSLPAMKAETR